MKSIKLICKDVSVQPDGSKAYSLFVQAEDIALGGNMALHVAEGTDFKLTVDKEYSLDFTELESTEEEIEITEQHLIDNPELKEAGVELGEKVTIAPEAESTEDHQE